MVHIVFNFLDALLLFLVFQFLLDARLERADFITAAGSFFLVLIRPAFLERIVLILDE